jgi:thiamine-monophosphate kinase
VSDHPPSASSPSEDGLLRWLKELDPELGRWIGDDTALLPAGGSRVVTVDTQIEGTHYPVGLDPRVVGRRLLAVNLSDLAAAGASPAFCFLSLATRPGFDHRRFFRAFLRCSHHHRLQLAGGDLASSTQTVASLTLMGSIPDGGRWLRRSDGEAGDGLWLGGTIGASALGRFLLAAGAATWRDGRVHLASPITGGSSQHQPLRQAVRRAVRRHLAPTPQLRLGHWLGRQERAAVIDLSDGFGKDLSRLCAASGVGAEIDVASLPLPPELDRLCAILRRPKMEVALAGGEDYVLLFSLPPAMSPPPRFRCRRVGTLTETPVVTWVGIETWGTSNQPSGDPGPSQLLGWDHLNQD